MVANCADTTFKSPSSSPHHSPTPAPHSGHSGQPDCGTMVYNMMDCSPYMAKNAKEAKPGSVCCMGFKKIMKTNKKCLCDALKSTADLGVSINITRAKTLPSACGVSYHLPKCDTDSIDTHQPSPSPGNPKHSHGPSKSKSPKSAPATPAPAPSKASASSSSTWLAILWTSISCFIFLRYESSIIMTA